MFAFIIFIYIVGYIFSYYWFKLLSIKVMKEKNWSWEDVRFGLKVSFGSWISIIILTCVVIGVKLESKKDTDKPPRWL